jgi:hypothetical protein
MAYDVNHTLVTFRGSNFTGTEQWSFGMRFFGSGTPTQTMADNAAAAGKTWITTASSGYAAMTKLDAVKVAPIGTDGKYRPGLVATESFPTSATGAYATATIHPPQIALAMTLQSSQPRGPVHQTHLYLPGPAFAFASGSLANIGASDAGNVIANFRTLVIALNAAGFGNLGIFSQKFAQSAVAVTFRLGRAFDTVRSRRTSIVENYQTLAL